MWSTFAFAAFVITPLAHSTVVQAQALRDTLPSQSNSTQDEILPRDYLASLSFANTSDTYSDSGASLERTIEARNPQPVTYVIFSLVRADNHLLFSSIMYTAYTQT